MMYTLAYTQNKENASMQVPAKTTEKTLSGSNYLIWKKIMLDSR